VQTNSSYTRTAHLAPYDFTRIAETVDDEVASVQSSAGPWAVGGAGDAMIVSSPGTQTGCVRQCICPDGVALGMPQFATDGVVAVGVTNAQTGVPSLAITVVVTSIPLDMACAARTPPPTTSSDLGCMVGQWRLTEQAFDDPFVPGLQGIDYAGGVRGRHLDIAPNGAYVMTDDGSDPVTGHGQTGGADVDVIVVLSGRVDGTVERTSPESASFTSSSASIDLHVRETVAGVPININHHYDEAAWFGNGDAVVTCDGTSMTTKFANASFTYTRE
jgi:hypothetical protein